MLKNKILKYTKNEYVKRSSDLYFYRKQNFNVSIGQFCVGHTDTCHIIYCTLLYFFLTFQNKNKAVKGVSYFWQEKYFLLYESMT